MSFAGTLLHHPRRLFLHRALFQIHLWAGVLLSLYVVAIALSGAVLVFRGEWNRAALPAGLNAYEPGRVAPIAAVLERYKAAEPLGKVTNLTMPSPGYPAYLLATSDAMHRSVAMLADPVTGAIHARRRSWVDWVYDLHVYLLLGKAHGMQVNAVGAAVLLVLCGTGIFLWWPGTRIWTRGLRIRLGHRWRRINFDAHQAIGFWTLAIVAWWAFSGLYFAWYRQVSAAVGAVSPLRGMVAPKAAANAAGAGLQRVSLHAVIEAAQRASPHGRMFSISDPGLTGGSVYALMDLRASGDFSHRDIVTISTQDARVLTVWHYRQNETAGDWIIWAMHPLHFGTLWGMAVKVLWAGLGGALAVLSVTGMLLYWNRYLRRIVLPDGPAARGAASS